jgi:hypothetical protein
MEAGTPEDSLPTVHNDLPCTHDPRLAKCPLASRQYVIEDCASDVTTFPSSISRQSPSSFTQKHDRDIKDLLNASCIDKMEARNAADVFRRQDRAASFAWVKWHEHNVLIMNRRLAISSER